MFTWARTRWLLSSISSYVVVEKRRNRLMPINTMPTIATAVKEREITIWIPMAR